MTTTKIPNPLQVLAMDGRRALVLGWRSGPVRTRYGTTPFAVRYFTMMPRTGASPRAIDGVHVQYLDTGEVGTVAARGCVIAEDRHDATAVTL